MAQYNHNIDIHNGPKYHNMSTSQVPPSTKSSIIGFENNNGVKLNKK